MCEQGRRGKGCVEGKGKEWKKKGGMQTYVAVGYVEERLTLITSIAPEIDAGVCGFRSLPKRYAKASAAIEGFECLLP